MGPELTTKIETLTGRKVATYQSQVLFDPHIVMEIFFFEDGDSEAPDAMASIDNT